MPKLKLAEFMPYRLSVASNRVSAAVATAYQSLFALKIAEWRLIAVLAEGQGATQQAIGVATRMDKVTVSRAAIALTARGLIERRPNPDDQRSHLLSLSQDGQALYQSVAPKALALEAEIFGGFRRAELSDLAAMLDRIEAAAARLSPEVG